MEVQMKRQNVSALKAKLEAGLEVEQLGSIEALDAAAENLEGLIKRKGKSHRRPSLERLRALQVLAGQISRLESATGSEASLGDLQQKLAEGLVADDLEDVTALAPKIAELDRLVNVRKKEHRRESLERLQNLAALADQIAKLEAATQLPPLSELEAQLSDGLAEEELDNVEALNAAVQTLERLVNEKQKTHRRDSLERLKGLLHIAEQVAERRSGMQDRVEKKQSSGSMIAPQPSAVEPAEDLLAKKRRQLQVGMLAEKIDSLSVLDSQVAYVRKRVGREDELGRLLALQVLAEEIGGLASKVGERSASIAGGADAGSEANKAAMVPAEGKVALDSEPKQEEKSSGSGHKAEDLPGGKFAAGLLSAAAPRQQYITAGVEPLSGLVPLSAEKTREFLPDPAATDLGKFGQDEDASSFKALFADYSRISHGIPESAEKTLLILHLAAKALCLDGRSGFYQLFAIDVLPKLLSCLETQLGDEGFLDAKAKRYLSDIKQLFNDDLSLAQENYDSLDDNIYLLLKHVQPVDLDLMLRYVRKSREAAGIIEGKEVLLLLGGTGSGKTTTIHFLSGSTLEKRDQAGLQHYQPVNYAVPEVERFITSPYARSETRSINALTFDLSNLEPGSKGDVTLCDTPGFGDTGGVEIDVANGLGVISAVQGCHTVRPVLLLSAHSLGDRAQGVAKLAKILVNILVDVKPALPALSYVFTKFSERERAGLHARLVDVRKRLERHERANLPFVALVDDMIVKTAGSVLSIDLEQDRPKSLLDRLLTSPAIKRPGSQFRHFVSPSSLSTLKEQLFKQRASIRNALERFDVPLLVFKFDQLKALSVELDIHDSHKIYQTVIAETQAIMLETRDKVVQRLAVAGDPSNTSVAGDISVCSQDLYRLFSLEWVRERHLSAEGSLHEFVAMQLNTFLTKLHADLVPVLQPAKALEIKPSPVLSIMHVRQAETALGKWHVLLRKLRKEFAVLEAEPLFLKQLGEQFQQVCTAIKQSFDQHVVAVQMAISQSEQVEQIAVSMRLVKQYYASFAEVLGADQSASAVERLVMAFSSQLGTLTQRLCDALVVPELKPGEDCAESPWPIDQVRQDYAFLAAASRYPDIASLFEWEQIQQCEQQAKTAVRQFFPALLAEAIRPQWAQFSGDCIPVLVNLLRHVDALLAQPDFKTAALESYQSITAELTEFVQSIKAKVDRDLLLLQSSLGQINEIEFAQLNQHVHWLKQAQGFVGHPAHICSEHIWQDALAQIDALSRMASERLVALEEGYQIEHLHQIRSGIVLFEQMDALLMPADAVFAVKNREVYQAQALSYQTCLVSDVVTLGDQLTRFLTEGELDAPSFLHRLYCLDLLVKSDVIDSALRAQCQTKQTELSAYLPNFVDAWQEKMRNTFAELTAAQVPKEKVSHLTHVFVGLLLPWVPVIESSNLNQEEEKQAVIDQPGLSNRSAWLADLNKGSRSVKGLTDSIKTILAFWLQPEDGVLNQQVEKYFQLSTGLEAGDIDAQNGVHHLKVAAALVALDGFMPGQTFERAMLAIESALKAQKLNAINQLNMAVTRQDYAGFAELYTQLSMHGGNASLLETALRTLEQALTDDTVLVESKIHDTAFSEMTLESTRITLQRLVGLCQARTHLADHFPAPLMTKLAEINAVLVEKYVAFEAALDQQIQDNAFGDAESSLRVVSALATLLPIFSIESRSVSTFHEQIDLTLQSAVEAFLQTPLADYDKQSPASLLDQVAKACPLASRYQMAYEQMESGLIEKVRLTVKSEQEPLEVLESLYRHLPKALLEKEELVALLEEGQRIKAEEVEQLKQTLDDIKAKLASRKRASEEGKIAAHLAQLLDILERYVVEGRLNSAAKICRTVYQTIDQVAARFRNDIETGSLDAVLKFLPKSWEDWWFYESKLKALIERAPERQDVFDIARLRHLMDEMLHVIRVAFAEHVGSLKSMLEGSASLGDQLQCIEKTFPAHDEMIKLAETCHRLQQKYPDSTHLFKDLMAKETSFDLALANMTALSDYFFTLNEAFDKHLGSATLAPVLDMLELAKRFAPLFDVISASFGSEHVRRHVGSDLTGRFAYAALQQRLSERLLALEKNVNVVLLNNAALKTSDRGRLETFYRDHALALKALGSATLLATHVDEKIIVLRDSQASAHAHVRSQLSGLHDYLQALVTRFPSDVSAEYDDFQIWQLNLTVFKGAYAEPALAQEAERLLKSLDRAAHDHIRQCHAELSADLDGALDNIAVRLIELKAMSFRIPRYLQFVHKQIDGVLLAISKPGAQRIATLALILRTAEGDQQDPAMRLINEHAAFEGYAVSLRNQKTLTYTEDNVLADLTGNNIDRGVLKSAYGDFYKTYWGYVESGLLDAEKEKAALIQAAQSTASGREPIAKKVVGLMACLFAYWTLDNSMRYLMLTDASQEAETSDDIASRSYLLQPHPAQVISIMRLLGVDGTQLPNLDNHFVQIGTGEGKSVTLAITASILAMLGYTIDCACYSEYLSERDYEAFASLFNAFGVQSNIHYGTFNKLAECWINEQADVRQLVLQAVEKNAPQKVAYNPQSETRILLVDEVDVFFTADFCGGSWRPVARLQHESIANLVRTIWQAFKRTGAAPSWHEVESGEPYKAAQASFSGWAFLIEQAAKEMLVDLANLEGHDYVVMHDKIGYRWQDGISFNLVYGYKTVFAYLKEHDAGNISSSSVEYHIVHAIDCGVVFSFAEMPKRYQAMLGVTGTLSTLSAPEKAILDEYQVKKFTFMPSVYGRNQVDFAGDNKRDFKIESKSGYFVAIRNEINTRLASEGGVDRAVLVFFERLETLRAFYESPLLADIKPQVKLITEAVSHDEKEGLVAQAVTSGSVTLLTRPFGRGTDFKCYDDRLNRSGGVHVIQTFPSDAISEEVQIIGRTARQGNIGSYSMILKDEDLERYGLGVQEIQQMRATGSLYTTFNKHRLAFFAKQFPETMRYVDEIRADHEASQTFLRDVLYPGDLDGIKAFLKNRSALARSQVNGRQGGRVAKTICLMDATGSMSGLLTKAKNTVHAMFERACEILAAKSVAGAFELQFVIYRNYDQPAEKLLQASSWESDPERLRQFMDSVEASGGTWLEEAVEVALAHANQMAGNDDQVTQVILIGDAPPNKPDQVTKGRAKLTEAYWQATEHFATPTQADQEVSRLAERRLPVHAFYVRDAAKTAFAQIAQATGGECEALDIDSPSGAERLTQLVTERILSDLGGDELIKAYRRKYVQGYMGDSKPSTQGLFAKNKLNNQGNEPDDVEQNSIDETQHTDNKMPD